MASPLPTHTHTHTLTPAPGTHPHHLFSAYCYRLHHPLPSTIHSYNQLSYNVTELEFNANHLAVARKAAVQSICLYKNDKNVLPLKPGVRLALVGPQATMAGLLTGNYAESASSGNWGLSILQALAAQASVIQADGCKDIGCKTSDMGPVNDAIAKSDTVVVVLGLAFNQYCTGDDDGKTDYCEREGSDRAVIELPGGQQRLVAAARAAAGSKPVIALLVHGGAIALTPAVIDGVDAIVDAW